MGIHRHHRWLLEENREIFKIWPANIVIDIEFNMSLIMKSKHECTNSNTVGYCMKQSHDIEIENKPSVRYELFRFF